MLLHCPFNAFREDAQHSRAGVHSLRRGAQARKRMLRGPACEALVRSRLGAGVS